MKVHILDPAKDDLAEGFYFYESRESDLGHYFLDVVYAEIDRLATTAGVHSRHGDLFRMLSETFPFSIYYRVEGSDVFVEAVIDQRRDPEWITERLN